MNLPGRLYLTTESMLAEDGNPVLRWERPGRSTIEYSADDELEDGLLAGDYALFTLFEGDDAEQDRLARMFLADWISSADDDWNRKDNTRR